MNKKTLSLITVLALVLLIAQTTLAQSTSFSYQGRLESGGGPANGNHDFEFALFDVPAGGTQLGSVVSLNNVAVTNGIFSVQLDFGNQFPGANRFLEIRVRPSGQPGMTVLAPRQPLNSSPYSVKSLTAETAVNAAQLGGVAANQFVVTTDPRMTDARSPTAGSGNYVQNRTTQQAATNFNISGNGSLGGTLTASAVTAATHYSIGGSRVLHIPGGTNVYLGELAGNAHTDGNSNVFVGFRAGWVNTSGQSNSFLGANSGFSNTTGISNSFFGSSAGSSNITGGENSFFGAFAGTNNTAGNDNAFFGFLAGRTNTSGGGNAFFGHRSGNDNTTGSTNSFFGYHSGEANTTGFNNAFFGANAGAANTTAFGNSFFGANAGAATTTGMGNSFFGASAGFVNTGVNNSFFGTVAGVANTTGFANSFFGHWAGHDNTTGDNNTFVGRSAGEFSTTGNGNTFIGQNSGLTNTTGSNNTAIGTGANVSSANLSFATAIGAGTVAIQSNFIQLGRGDGSDTVGIPGQLIVATMPSGGATNLCRGVTFIISTCASSLRYKTGVETFIDGLSVVRRLRPVSFDWKGNGVRDVGFVAEEVNDIEPLLVTFEKGRIEGVKYGQVTTVLVNAVKEQQAQIEELRRQIEELKALICMQNPSANLCTTGILPRDGSEQRRN